MLSEQSRLLDAGATAVGASSRQDTSDNNGWFDYGSLSSLWSWASNPADAKAMASQATPTPEPKPQISQAAPPEASISSQSKTASAQGPATQETSPLTGVGSSNSTRQAQGTENNFVSPAALEVPHDANKEAKSPLDGEDFQLVDEHPGEPWQVVHYIPDIGNQFGLDPMGMEVQPTFEYMPAVDKLKPQVKDVKLAEQYVIDTDSEGNPIPEVISDTPFGIEHHQEFEANERGENKEEENGGAWVHTLSIHTKPTNLTELGLIACGEEYEYLTAGIRVAKRNLGGLPEQMEAPDSPAADPNTYEGKSSTSVTWFKLKNTTKVVVKEFFIFAGGASISFTFALTAAAAGGGYKLSDISLEDFSKTVRVLSGLSLDKRIEAGLAFFFSYFVNLRHNMAFIRTTFPKILLKLAKLARISKPGPGEEINTGETLAMLIFAACAAVPAGQIGRESTSDEILSWLNGSATGFAILCGRWLGIEAFKERFNLWLKISQGYSLELVSGNLPEEMDPKKLYITIKDEKVVCFVKDNKVRKEISLKSLTPQTAADIIKALASLNPKTAASDNASTHPQLNKQQTRIPKTAADNKAVTPPQLNDKQTSEIFDITSKAGYCQSRSWQDVITWKNALAFPGSAMVLLAYGHKFGKALNLWSKGGYYNNLPEWFSSLLSISLGGFLTGLMYEDRSGSLPTAFKTAYARRFKRYTYFGQEIALEMVKKQGKTFLLLHLNELEVEQIELEIVKNRDHSQIKLHAPTRGKVLLFLDFFLGLASGLTGYGVIKSATADDHFMLHDIISDGSPQAEAAGWIAAVGGVGPLNAAISLRTYHAAETDSLEATHTTYQVQSTADDIVAFEITVAKDAKLEPIKEILKDGQDKPLKDQSAAEWVTTIKRVSQQPLGEAKNGNDSPELVHSADPHQKPAHPSDTIPSGYATSPLRLPAVAAKATSGEKQPLLAQSDKDATNYRSLTLTQQASQTA